MKLLMLALNSPHSTGKACSSTPSCGMNLKAMEPLEGMTQLVAMVH